jgi:Ca-activated chloride channel family protein
MIKALFISILALSPLAHGGELRGIIKNNEGVSRYDKGKPMDAYGFFTDSLGELPFAPEIQYNIGDSFLQMKDLDKAISQYKLAIKLAPGSSKREKEVRFRSLFNIGAVLASQNKTDEALESYQQALEMKPDSIETKTNMELLTQTGGSGGKGDKDSKDKKDDGEGGDDQKDKQVSNKPRENQPQPYKGKDLSRQDVDRILDELKQQEEAIRAKDQREGGKDAPPDKDW